MFGHIALISIINLVYRSWKNARAEKIRWRAMSSARVSKLITSRIYWLAGFMKPRWNRRAFGGGYFELDYCTIHKAFKMTNTPIINIRHRTSSCDINKVVGACINIIQVGNNLATLENKLNKIIFCSKEILFLNETSTNSSVRAQKSTSWMQS